MDDLQVWNQGVAKLTMLLSGFSGEKGAALGTLLASYKKVKEELSAAVAAVDAASICSGCAGQCCLNGKYRLNVLDALAGIKTGGLPTPDFSQKPLCPYGTEAGCTMDSGVRPSDCVQFTCEAIEMKLTPEAGAYVAEQERALRGCILTASRLTGEQMELPLLLWAEKLR